MGARAFSHSGFFCGRRGARSIWTSSTELAIRVLDVNLYCTMRGPLQAGWRTDVTLNPLKLSLKSRFCGRKLTHNHPMALVSPRSAGALGAAGRCRSAHLHAPVSFRLFESSGVLWCGGFCCLDRL